jgi:hypothetical protein
MKRDMVSKILLAAIAVLLVVNLVVMLGGGHRSAHAQAQRTYKYKVVFWGISEKKEEQLFGVHTSAYIEKGLNQFGSDGWELVSLEFGILDGQVIANAL